MKHIILEGNETGALVFDVADLEAQFANLTDPRAEKGKVYPLSMLLYTTYGGQQSHLISVDGKTMRGTIPKGKT